ncbi:hypothetical protein FA13DRAFT_1730021 [Coprinellus micaceus]|uniref:Ubiquitin-like domain-containing protein n=1 Tax=Coprinellus micaceus TaxID=71717 RepID=A0A4Y7TIE7_COPMI|nr:hypothetical protein FA13DRAFT_1730021 [Coprinellus micaceus]
MTFTDANALVITDALGETLHVPWSFVPSYDDLHRMLVGHFRWKIGEQRVAKRRYCVARAGGADGGTLVTADDWESIRDNREHLVMSMLIEQIFREELQELCPKCGKTQLGTYEDQGWRVCRRCNTRYILPGSPECRKIKRETNDAAFRHVRTSQVKDSVSPVSFEQ